MVHEIDAVRRGDGQQRAVARRALLESQVGDRHAVRQQRRRRHALERVLDAQVDDAGFLGDVADADRVAGGELLERGAARADDAARGARSVVDLPGADGLSQCQRRDALFERRVGAIAMPTS